MKLENHCFNAAPPGQREPVACVTLSMALAAIEQARKEERERCEKLCEPYFNDALFSDDEIQVAKRIAAAIRARKP